MKVINIVNNNKLYARENPKRRKIIGPRLTEKRYRLRLRATTEKLSNLAVDIKRRRLKFYGRVSRISQTTLTNTDQYSDTSRDSKPLHAELSQIKIDLRKAQIYLTDALDTNT